VLLSKIYKNNVSADGFDVVVMWDPGKLYRGADNSLARPTSRCILFDGENISFYASLVIYIKIVLIFLQL
jgi:hypothetical protein